MGFKSNLIQNQNKNKHFQTVALFAILFTLLLGFSSLASAKAVSKMVIITSAQSLAIGHCSAVVTVQAQDVNSKPTNVPSNTKVFFTGSSSSLQFYSDSNCATTAATVTMNSGTSSKNFYFKGSSVGTQILIVATYNYIDGQQNETLTTVSPTPTPVPTPTPRPTPLPSPTPSPTPITTVGRPIPTPLYGITFDNVANSVLTSEVNTLKQFVHVPTSRIVFDPGMAASYYAPAIQAMRPYTYILGQIADSSEMSSYTVSSIQARALQYTQTLGSQVDVWEIGNEVNGGWLGSNTEAKIEAMYDVVSAAQGATALTFFYEGEPSDPNNCLDSPSNDMFTWINDMFQMSLPANERSAETEKIRLGLNYALISFYPTSCPNVTTDWPTIYSKLAAIFPNSKVGFGELGTPSPQNGSTTEINMINQYYPMAKTTPLPASYIGGYFWWNFAEEMSSLFSVINNAIK